MSPPDSKPIGNGSRAAAGLTLTEVVTCVVMAVFLAGVAVAALGRGRQASQQQVCLNNLRIIAAASADYAAQDPGNHAIPMHPLVYIQPQNTIGDYQYGGKSGDGTDSSARKYTIEGGAGSYTRPLNWLLYDMNALVSPECRTPQGANNPECREADRNLDLEIYHCPSDSGYTGLHYTSYKNSGLSSYDYFGTSYVANYLMICAGAAGPRESSTPFLRSLDRVPNPARTILYLENCAYFAWIWGFGPWGFGTDFTVGGWHGQDWWFNVVFCDGHADYLQMQGQGETGIVETADDVEYVPGLPGGMQSWWQTITRGPGWQRDCLPSPPVPTGVNCY